MTILTANRTSVGTPWTTPGVSAVSRTRVTQGTDLLSTSAEVGPMAGIRRRWQEAIRAIDKMRWLGDDWDGVGGNAPSHAVVDSVVALAARLEAIGVEPPSRVAPGDGSVVLAWQSGGTYAHIEVSHPYVAEVYTSMPDGVSSFVKIAFGTTPPQQSPPFPSEMIPSRETNRRVPQFV